MLPCHDGHVGGWERADAPPEWLASDDEPHGAHGCLGSLVVFGLPVAVLLFAGAMDTGWGLSLLGVFVVAGVVIGTVDAVRDRRAVVSITMDGPDEFAVRQIDGTVVRYPFAAVSRVRVVREDGDDTLRMRISVGERKVRTRSGRETPAASTFLVMCAEAGADVTYRTETSAD